jgi:hypothetical protein
MERQGMEKSDFDIPVGFYLKQIFLTSSYVIYVVNS